MRQTDESERLMSLDALRGADSLCISPFSPGRRGPASSHVAALLDKLAAWELAAASFARA